MTLRKIVKNTFAQCVLLTGVHSSFPCHITQNIFTVRFATPNYTFPLDFKKVLSVAEGVTALQWRDNALRRIDVDGFRGQEEGKCSHADCDIH